ncbi:MFS transporter [Ruminiclostridium papyrosolvens]|uniref:MFS transporter n=1 Tax=Ruminiclostridium papyrosolvens C7 TaxID=1330534 RepID=U4R1M2_9FIRM|nr:MFS transporter [Ruminiclostridium papyrosolvens]EPR12125.1 MFS transporter [Ruminiclostridium papyrosolvens C7]
MNDLSNNWKKNIILFLTSQTISLLGSSLVQYAIIWYITMTTQSGIMMTISIICGFVPTFFLSPFAGVWADRYNRKVLIMVSDSLIALATLIMAILFMAGYDSMWLLFVVLGIRALGTAVQTPTVGAFIPQIVPQENLTKVNGINGSIQALVMLASPMLSGALMSVTTIKFIFFIDVFTAVIAIMVLLLFVHVPLHNKAVNKQSMGYFKDFHEGLIYTKNHRYLRTFFIFEAVFLILAAPAAFLTPLQVTRTFGNDVWRLTAIEIVFSAGMSLGGIIMASWGGFKNKAYTMAISTLVTGICTIVLGIVPMFWVYLIFMGIIGISMPVFNIPSTVLLQEKVEEEYMGRIFGVLSMITSSMMPIGMLVFGPLADYIRIEWLLRVTGLFIVVIGIALYLNKVLIEAGKPSAQIK